MPGRGGLLQQLLLLLGARDDAGHTTGAARMLLVADEAAPLPPHVQAGLAGEGEGRAGGGPCAPTQLSVPVCLRVCAAARSFLPA